MCTSRSVAGYSSDIGREPCHAARSPQSVVGVVGVVGVAAAAAPAR